MKKAFVLAVDLDDVVGNYGEAFRRFVAADQGRDPAELPDREVWSFVNEAWRIPDEETYAQLHRRAVVEGRIFRTMPEMPDAAATLWDLSDAGVWIRIVTHRMYVNWSHRAAVSDTVEWLEYGPPGAALVPGRRTFIPYRDICFISDKPEVGAHLYLDDGPHNVLALREAGDQVLVYDQRYNRHLGGPRVHDWSEVGREVHAALARYQASA